MMRQQKWWHLLYPIVAPRFSVTTHQYLLNATHLLPHQRKYLKYHQLGPTSHAPSLHTTTKGPSMVFLAASSASPTRLTSFHSTSYLGAIQNPKQKEKKTIPGNSLNTGIEKYSQHRCLHIALYWPFTTVTYQKLVSASHLIFTLRYLQPPIPTTHPKTPRWRYKQSSEASFSWSRWATMERLDADFCIGFAQKLNGSKYESWNFKDFGYRTLTLIFSLNLESYLRKI